MFDVPFYSFKISEEKEAQEQMWPEKKNLSSKTLADQSWFLMRR